MKKIIIIGQAPPSPRQHQDVPYSSTMLYEWLEECGISKQEAQEIFEFDAVYDKFPGAKYGGGHEVPTYEQMEDYWNRSLQKKLSQFNKVIIFGAVPKTFLLSKNALLGKNVIYIMHPSRMNSTRYNRNKDSVLIPLKEFINFKAFNNE
jgi:hypothetical protein